jgi:predicted DNA-binding transcriptional regulator
MKDVTPILQSLGLLDSEIRTYLAALENGPGTVLEIAKQTKLSRQATYVAIEMLTERGLMSSLLRGKKRFYVAEPPAKLLAYAKRRDAETHDRVRDLESLVPELELRMGGERPVVRVFEGKEGLQAIIEDMRLTKFHASSEIADLEALYKVLTADDLKGMRAELRRRGVKIRGLYAGVPAPKVVDTERFFLPKEYAGFKADIGVYGNKIEMLTFEGKMYSVIIESEPLAKTLQILFDLAMRGSRELPKG